MRRRRDTRSQHSFSKLAYSVAIGLDYQRWVSASATSVSTLSEVSASIASGASRLRLSEYASRKWNHGKVVPKKVKVWLARCIKLVPTMGPTQTLRGKSKGSVPYAYIIRRAGLQGRPMKAPMLGEFLWDWFVDIKTAVCARIHPRLMLYKARSVASAMLRKMRKTNQFVELPVLDKHWLRRWKQRYHVSLRKPNRRYKCSRAKLLTRLRAMWIFNFRVRALSLACLSRDMTIVGFDQKPLHFNEQGSKCAATLHFEGCPEVVLKENHAATRERFSLMTSVTSSAADASVVGGPPLQVLFKGTERILRDLEVPQGVNMSLAFGPKGSYRLEHVLAFLNWALAPWTEARRDARDYRLLYLDAYAAHLDEGVKDLAWERGYVLAIHWGCTTGICQVNDTDLHHALSSEYMYCESVSFMDQQMMDLGNISRSRQQVLDDVGAVWSSLDHQQGVLGHLRVGLANNLDGSQDDLLTREAADMWHQLNMAPIRSREVEDIERRVRAGELSWSQESIKSIFAYPEDGDVGAFHEEGMEADGELEDDEAMWADGDGMSSDGDIDGQASALLAPVDAVVASGDTPAQIEVAEAFAARSEKLEALAKSADEVKAHPVRWYVERELAKLRKSHRGATQKTAVLRRWLARRRDDEQRRLQQIRIDARRKRACKLKSVALAKKIKARTLAAKVKAKANRQALAKLPKHFTPEGLGQGRKGGGTKVHVDARIALLERLRLRSPPLPPELEVLWPDFVSKYAKWLGTVQDVAVGVWLLGRVESVMQKLGDHLLTPDGKPHPPSGSPCVGNPIAFEKWVRAKWEGLPKAASSMIL